MQIVKVERRPHVCTVCGAEQQISTNHREGCFAHCNGCSWKAEGFGPGVRMFGTVHRFFRCTEEVKPEE